MQVADKSPAVLNVGVERFLRRKSSAGSKAALRHEKTPSIPVVYELDPSGDAPPGAKDRRASGSVQRQPRLWLRSEAPSFHTRL